MSDERRGRQYRLWAVVLAVLLVAAGAVALVVGLQSQQEPPQPPAATASASATPTATAVPGPEEPTTPSPSPVADAQGPVLPASVPTRIDIPAIDVTSGMIDLGLNPDGTVEVPPLAEDSTTGWFHGSPTPGELGPSVILGHVDSAEYGPAIFFRLGELRSGDQVEITRADGTVAVFTVDRVVSYPKESFPTLEVYGNTDRAELRLITCGGEFDPGSRNYLDNIVAYASLTDSHPA